MPGPDRVDFFPPAKKLAPGATGVDLTLTGALNVGALSTARYLGANGSAAAPTFSFSSAGNDDNGMYLINTDYLGFATGGRQRMALLGGSDWAGGYFFGGTSYGIEALIGADATHGWTGSNGAYPFAIRTGLPTTDRMTIGAAGEVGIGMNPAGLAPLDVLGTIRSYQPSNPAYRLDLRWATNVAVLSVYSDGDGLYKPFYLDATSLYLRYDGVNPLFQVDTTGRVITGLATGAGQWGDITVCRSAANTTGVIYFGTGGGGGSCYIHYDGTNFNFARGPSNVATLSSNGTITTSGEFDDAGRRRKTPLAVVTPDEGMAWLRRVIPRRYMMVNEPQAGVILGFFAEELAAASPDLSDRRHYMPQHLETALVAAIQQLDRRLATLERVQGGAHG